MRRLSFVAVVLVAATVAVTAAAAEPARPAAARAPVVVALVVDQLGAWIADERWPLLPATGGFARLRREGTWAHAIVYPYAVSDTAPGHAALFTGALPRDSGIFGNEVVDDSGKRSAIVRDPTTRLLASDGPRDLPSSSLRALQVPTLADALRAAKPSATIIALSLKDRAALMGGGRHPTAALWFDTSLGRFVTSTAVMRAFPEWALPIVGPDFLRTQLARVWQPLDAAFIAAHAATPDAQPGEGDLEGLGTTFPHALAATSDPARAFRATPFADEALLQLAVAAVDQRRAGEPMLLAVSLSANDYVGHTFGPDSWEAWDELVRLDAALARFFAALDEKLGADGWSALLSADHGAETMPEAAALARPWCGDGTMAMKPDRFARPCTAPGRIVLEALTDELRAVAVETLGDGDPALRWVSGVADPYVYVSPAARALDEPRRRRLDDALAAFLRGRSGVAAVFDARHPPARCPARGEDLAALVCRSMPRQLPGELYVALAPGWFFDPDIVVGKGSSHGSAYRFDRTVPLLVRAPGRVAAGRSLDDDMGPAAYARTAAALLGIAPPAAARAGRDLSRSP